MADTDTKKVRFDFDRVNALFEELDAVIYRLENLEVEVDPITDNIRANSTEKAEISRDLQRAEDLAHTIATEVKMVYWAFKGRKDPR